MKHFPKERAMFLVFILSFILSLLPDEAFARGRTRVRGYFRKNGTYVAPHYRTSPDSSKYNNYSYPGNFNPNKGEFTPIPGNEVWVDGYFKEDGTWVSGHYRNAPNTRTHNYDIQQNVITLPSPHVVPLPEMNQGSVNQGKGNDSNERKQRQFDVPGQMRNEQRKSYTSMVHQDMNVKAIERATYWKERGYTFDPKCMSAFQMDMRVKDTERAKYWKERGYTFDPQYMTAFQMDTRVKNIERAKYWEKKGYTFDPSCMSAIQMDTKVKNIERAKYWKEQGYTFDPAYMSAFQMDTRVMNIERAKYWKKRGYTFDPEHMSAFQMDKLVIEGSQQSE